MARNTDIEDMRDGKLVKQQPATQRALQLMQAQSATIQRIETIHANFKQQHSRSDEDRLQKYQSSLEPCPGNYLNFFYKMYNRTYGWLNRF
jgi:hypothetical protein